MELKEKFVKRIKQIVPDYDEFFRYCSIPIRSIIRANTLKMDFSVLSERLRKKWEIEEIKELNAFAIKSKLLPGELGRSIEHQLGYYYVQELSSMLPIFALSPTSKDYFLDLCASPGSKTSQAAALMKNQGFILANDLNLNRISILSANLQRMGVSNAMTSMQSGDVLCSRLKDVLKFDKILVDAPCSGEGTIRSNESAAKTWNANKFKKFHNLQRKLLFSAVECLKENGEIVYSTCTLAPEENESVINEFLNKFDFKLVRVNLPVKRRDGIEKWKNEKFNFDTKLVNRIYPQDNDCEGFFIAKLRKC